MSIRYPKSADYQAAIQSPDLFLNDTVLRKGRALTDANNLPKVRSGGFAAVYFLEAESVTYAVKCFTRSTQNLEHRYRLITAWLAEHPLPWFVAFEFQPQGIYVNQAWWPLVKMDALDSPVITSWISSHLNSRDLFQLRKNFQSMILDLEAQQIAHGDLQHGNILTGPQGQLSLIDYDGMFIPGMPAEYQSEVGHKNFQHPARKASDFNSGLDRFSALVIDLSLEALSLDPNLWENYHDGENLLFNMYDYRDPHNSRVLREIARLPGLEPKVRDLIRICSLPLSQTPAFSAWVAGSYSLPEENKTMETPALPTRTRSQYPVLSGDYKHIILSYEGEIVTVFGLIRTVHRGNTKYGKPYYFLNFGDWRQGDCYIIIWSEGLEYLAAQGIRPESFEGRWISFTALVEEYQGKPNLVFYPDQGARINLLQSEDKKRLQKEMLDWEEYSPDISVLSSDTGQPAPRPSSNREVLARIHAQATAPAPRPAPAAGGNCWIAGVVYQDPLHPRVLALRRYRDSVLASSSWGRLVISLYRSSAPRFSIFLSRHPRLCRILRRLLDYFSG